MSAYQGGQPPAEGAWHTLEAGDVATRLGSPEGGLSEVEAARRREQWGPNTLTRRGGDGPWKVLGRQLASPLIWVLLGSSGLAVALGKLTDGLVVLAVVVLNSAIGFVQEYRAGRAIEALAAMAPDRTSVLRGEQVVMLPTSDLVPGDRVILAAGDKIPADLRLLGVTSLQVEEAALTGESVPVPKRIEPVALEAVLGDRTGMAFSGTLVTRGSGVGVVVATGDRTELGRVSSLLEGAADLQTPLTRALAGVARLITAAILVVATVLLAVGMVRAIGAGATIGYALRESVMFAIALAVGAIPEGLPAIVTIALAIGVRRMVVRRAIIRRLPAVETLGSTTVICTDKTGTLTRNEMTAVELWTPSGACEITGVGWEPAGSFVRRGEVVEDIPADLGRLLLHGLLCSDAELAEEGGRWHIVGDPTEAALVVLAAKAGLVASRERLASPRIDALPFSSDTQIMATLHRSGDGPDFVAVKGSPEVILERCQNPEGWPPLEVAEVLAQAERMASRGLRVLAVANREWVSERITLDASDVARGLTFTGLVGLLDPPRPEAIAAVRACQSAGVTVKMITGDHPATARAIAAQIGLGEGAALTGVELARLGPNELRVQARACQVFARVAPEHKLRLVQALQDEGEVVAMTGDGVNDAPALRQADIGVAMGITGTAVAREAADMLITDDNFSSIVAAVEEGRRVYDNLVKSLVFVLPTNLVLALILLVAVAFFPFDPVTHDLLLPLLPAQLLWINLVATVTLALPLAFEGAEPDLMARPPRAPRAPVLSGFVVQRTILASLLGASAAIGLFLWEYFRTLGAGAADPVAIGKAQTMAVTAVIAFQVFYLLKCRSLRRSVWTMGFSSNPAVVVGIGTIVVLQAAFVYVPALNLVFHSVPLAWDELGRAVLAGALTLPLMSVEKWLDHRAPTTDPGEGRS